jgi:hypothetical protein
MIPEKLHIFYFGRKDNATVNSQGSSARPSDGGGRDCGSGFTNSSSNCGGGCGNTGMKKLKLW